MNSCYLNYKILNIHKMSSNLVFKFSPRCLTIILFIFRVNSFKVRLTILKGIFNMKREYIIQNTFYDIMGLSIC